QPFTGSTGSRSHGCDYWCGEALPLLPLRFERRVQADPEVGRRCVLQHGRGVPRAAHAILAAVTVLVSVWGAARSGHGQAILRQHRDLERGHALHAVQVLRFHPAFRSDVRADSDPRVLGRVRRGSDALRVVRREPRSLLPRRDAPSAQRQAQDQLMLILLLLLLLFKSADRGFRVVCQGHLAPSRCALFWFGLVWGVSRAV
ncbi:unnamed protein product, partial [Ascophyllum nodosum]